MSPDPNPYSLQPKYLLPTSDTVLRKAVLPPSIWLTVLTEALGTVDVRLEPYNFGVYKGFEGLGFTWRFRAVISGVMSPLVWAISIVAH